MAEAEEQNPAAKQAKLIYILYLVGLVIPLTPLVGLIMAYMGKGEADETVLTHYRWQIRTFWIGLLYILIGSILTIVVIGFLVLLAQVVWYIVRCVKGLQAIERGAPIESVESWLW